MSAMCVEEMVLHVLDATECPTETSLTDVEFVVAIETLALLTDVLTVRAALASLLKGVLGVPQLRPV